MQAFTTVTGVVAPLDRNDVDTDQIIPKQFLKRIERTGFGEFLFYDWRDADDYLLDAAQYAGAPILVSGRNFGCGSSREHAPWALEDFGFRAIIAPSFADIFRTNCTKIGVLPVVLAQQVVRDLITTATTQPGATATVDLERRVVVTPDGSEHGFEIEGAVRSRLLNGWDDISLTLEHEEDIATYERERERTGPYTTSESGWVGDPPAVRFGANPSTIATGGAPAAS
ncbi:MAG: 3-isopropylmalate dehydratase small subunit [Thermoleophilia bacterium]|nr:3-isopropylmalate dehydratase small subunit [Thermoleophilia bacterium]MDH3724372.1 3-isopropylmalate dehydratase small subunit [Thermoleophilia bacterium]